MTTLTVPTRFNGPEGSGNGGWTAGALALLLRPVPGQAVTVRLRRPPPLDTPLQVQLGDGTATASLDDGGVVLEASLAAGDALPEPVPSVAEATAAAAAARYGGTTGHHPFPTCFACGPDRPLGDGLHLTPGPLADRPGDTACVWAPHEQVDVPSVWAALDCPGGWTVDQVGQPRVLGTITAVVQRLPDPGERCVVTARALGSRGRTTTTATTLWSGGDVLARAGAVWVAVDLAGFGQA